MMLWLMISLRMIVMMIGVVMEASMWTVKHTEVTEAPLTLGCALAAHVMRTQSDVTSVLMMTVITRVLLG